MALLHSLQVEGGLVFAEVRQFLRPAHQRPGLADEVAAGEEVVLDLLFGDVVPESVGGEHDHSLAGLGRVELVITPVEDVRYRLLLLRVAVALHQVVLSPEDLVGHVELPLLLLGDEVAASWAEDAEHRVADVVAAQ